MCLFPKTTSRKLEFSPLSLETWSENYTNKNVKRRKQKKASLKVTLTMEGNLKEPQDGAQLHSSLKCFHLPGQVALVFEFHTVSTNVGARREDKNYSTATLMLCFITTLNAAPV